MLCLLLAGRPVMIVVEYVENGSLDSFLRVSVEVIKELKHGYVFSWPWAEFLEIKTQQNHCYEKTKA